jgi:hypothetical protein
VVRETERTCRTFEQSISPYPPPKVTLALEAFGRAEDVLRLLDQDSADRGSSLSDPSLPDPNAVSRPKKRRVEAAISTAASLIVVVSVGFMAVMLSPQKKPAATQAVSDAARVRSGDRAKAEDTIGTNDVASAVDPNGANESTPSPFRTQPEKSEKQIESMQLVNYWTALESGLSRKSPAIPTEAEVRNPSLQRKSGDKLQSAIRELFIRSATNTSHRDPGISTQ